MPAAVVIWCSSQMPTSRKRSGKRSAKPESPVPEAMPAVRAKTLGFVTARSHSAAPKASDQATEPAGTDLRPPVAGSKGPVECHASGSFSAGANPSPLRVRTWSRTGTAESRRARKAPTSRGMSCPSSGPT